MYRICVFAFGFFHCIILRLIHIIACIDIFIPLCSTSLFGNILFDLSIYQLIHFFAIMSNDTLNIDGQVFEWMNVFISFRSISRSRIFRL